MAFLMIFWLQVWGKPCSFYSVLKKQSKHSVKTKPLVLFLVYVRCLACFVRYIYTGIVVFLFTKPIRDEEPPLPILLLQHFAKGIPVESNTHTNLKMESIYRSEEIGQQLAMKKKKMQGSRVRIHSWHTAEYFPWAVC